MTAARNRTQPTPTPNLLVALSLLERARPIIGEHGPYDRARQRRRELSRVINVV
jgi:hypothetical protein